MRRKEGLRQGPMTQEDFDDILDILSRWFDRYDKRKAAESLLTVASALSDRAIEAQVSASNAASLLPTASEKSSQLPTCVSKSKAQGKRTRSAA